MCEISLSYVLCRAYQVINGTLMTGNSILALRTYALIVVQGTFISTRIKINTYIATIYYFVEFQDYSSYF